MEECISYHIPGDEHSVPCEFKVRPPGSATNLGRLETVEARDYASENGAVTLTPQDRLFHAFDCMRAQVQRDPSQPPQGPEDFMVLRPRFLLWWLFGPVGHAHYQGGWFTHNRHEGGPTMTGRVHFRPLEDIDLIFFGQEYRKRWEARDLRYYTPHQILTYEYFRYLSGQASAADTRARIAELRDSMAQRRPDLRPFAEGSAAMWLAELDRPVQDQETSDAAQHAAEMMGGFYPEPFGASHLVKGPAGWAEKGYAPIMHPPSSFADELGLRLTTLGFRGYASCDECEVYLAHETQRLILPEKWEVEFEEHAMPFVVNALRLVSDAWEALSVGQKLAFVRGNRGPPAMQTRGDMMPLSMYAATSSEWVAEAVRLLPFVKAEDLNTLTELW